MPDVFGQLKETYEDMGMKFGGGDKGPSSLTWPDLMSESAEIIAQRRKLINQYNNKVILLETGSGVLTGGAGSSYELNPRGDTKLDRVGRTAMGALRQGASNAGYAIRDVASQWRNRAYGELQQELTSDQDMENFYRQKLQIVGQTNINERERLASEMFSDTEKAARLYKTLSLHDGEAVSLERFKSVFGMSGMKINETVWTDIQGRGFAIAQKELNDMTLGQAASNGRTVEKQKEKNATKDHHDDDDDKPKSKKSSKSKRGDDEAPNQSSGNEQPSKSSGSGEISRYAAALQEVNNDPMLNGSSAADRRETLLEALKDEMLSDKKAYFLHFGKRKDLGFNEFMAQPGMQEFKNLFGDNPKKAEKAFEAFEKEVDLQVKQGLGEKGENYKIAHLTRSEQREFMASINPVSVEGTDKLDLTNLPKLQGAKERVV